MKKEREWKRSGIRERESRRGEERERVEEIRERERVEEVKDQRQIQTGKHREGVPREREKRDEGKSIYFEQLNKLIKAGTFLSKEGENERWGMDTNWG